MTAETKTPTLEELAAQVYAMRDLLLVVSAHVGREHLAVICDGFEKKAQQIAAQDPLLSTSYLRLSQAMRDVNKGDALSR